MAVTTDLEDVNSLCLTVVARLLKKTRVDKRQIGRLEVGTESNQDRSKSVKTFLMRLFEPENTDICGVDNVNACYGGTAALLNCINWIESHDWDGRLAIVVAGDVAVYDEGPARPTGGAGAVALLIGPDAPLVLERGTTGHCMGHVFDFYKANPTSEYPIVDGKLSIDCYMKALSVCYQRHLSKIQRKNHNQSASLRDFDYFVFHSPYKRLLQRAFCLLKFIDTVNNREPGRIMDDLPQSSTKEELDRIFKKVANEFRDKVEPVCDITAKIGNCYCASLYVGLVSLLAGLDASSIGKRIGLFSFGSGFASTMFSLIVVADPTGITPSSDELWRRLQARTEISVLEYVASIKEREVSFNSASWAPKRDPSIFSADIYYLQCVDHLFRRIYTVSSSTSSD